MTDPEAIQTLQEIQHLAMAAHEETDPAKRAYQLGLITGLANRLLRLRFDPENGKEEPS
ncbi:MAG: hypothetical protein J2P48_18630 [Alphaproteobacteria bacterium]|nr:hypothetical protein [Alphaproteobacteria bacterium]